MEDQNDSMSGFMKLETCRGNSNEDCFMPDWMMSVMMEDSQWLDSYQRSAMKKSMNLLGECKIEVVQEENSDTGHADPVSVESRPEASQGQGAYALPAGEFANWSKLESNVTAETRRLLTEAKYVPPSDRALNKSKLLRMESDNVKDGPVDME